MSMSGITFSGLASGLDTGAIISALLSIEQRPIAALAQKKKDYGRQKDLFGTLEDKLAALRDKANAVRKSASFLDFKTTLDTDDYLSASASTSATQGTYNIKVNQLAKAQVNSSLGSAAKDSADYSGSFIIGAGGSNHTVTLSGSATLEEVAAAINASSAGEHVQAQVLDTGQGSTPYKLVINSKEAGSDNSFTLTTDVGNAALDALVTEIAGNQDIAATNAVIDLNGIVIERGSNTFTDVIKGVTIDLKGESAGAVTKLTVGPDGSATAEKVKAFVDAYNEIVDFAKAAGEVDDKGNAANPLFGDTTLRGIQSSLRSIVGGSVDTGNTSYSLLSQVGIEADTSGRLTFTQSKFEDAINGDEDAVRTLFSDATKGIAQRVYDQIDVYTDTVDGLIKVRKDGFDRLIRDTDNQIDRAERRLVQFEANLRQRFANLEALMSRLQSQGSALGSFKFG